MKKIYSFVLMAMMLLVGTNAWAIYDAGWLQAQFDAVPADGQTHKITMEDDIILTSTVYLGTANVDDPRKSIILEMKGHTISMDATNFPNGTKTNPGKWCQMFSITHGELLVHNEESSDTAKIYMKMTGNTTGEYNNIFNVAGSYKSSRWVKNGNSYVTDESAAINTRAANGGWFTHLEIGAGVMLVADAGVSGAGISIDGYYTNYHAMVSSNGNTSGVFGTSGLTTTSNRDVCLYNRSDAPLYNTAILSKESEGVAYGVRVDIYGDIQFATGAQSGKSYGIKLNGGLRSSLRSPEKFENRYCWAMDDAYAQTYGATAATPTEISIDSTSATAAYKKAYFDHRLDTVDAPFLYVHSSARIIAAAVAEKATAVYCSGYGKTLIEGECKGHSGVNIKSGTVELHDADIASTATEYTTAQQGNNATGSGGVIVNSVEQRAGGVEVIISGDTKVSTTVGYAIEEVVNTKDGHTDVSAIAIQGGTIEGGSLGAIAITTESKSATEVSGGNVSGSASVGGNPVDVSELVPQGGGYHTTEVVVDGKTTVVVSQGDAPSDVEETTPNDPYSIMGASGSVNWTGTYPQIINGNKTLEYLEMNLTTGTPKVAVAQKLTIKAGYKLTVGRVVLGEAAVIIVEPGAKLIVTGAQGIVAPKASNIVLKTSETAQAMFLFNPAVTSNRHPNATVEFDSESYVGEGDDWTRQCFGIPSYGKLTSIEAINTALEPTDPKYNVRTRFGRFNYEANTWENIGEINSSNPAVDLNDMADPFNYYQMINYASTATTKVIMKGALVGNEIPQLHVRENFWNGYANSCMAPMNIQVLLAEIPNTVDKTIYLLDIDAAQTSWEPLNLVNLTASSNIPALRPFLIRNTKAAAAVDVVYEYAVYNPTMGIANPALAPARRIATDLTKVKLVVNGENCKDRLIVVADDEFSAEYDNGYDAVKRMNDGINMYVSDNEKMAIFATDNLDNTYVGFQTVNGGTYTIEFADVQGAELTLIDHETGAQVLMVEGNAYEFTAAANTANDYRFEIVESAKLPTAIDNTEAVKSIKGIYTITGQYLGEMNVWNTLPAGVYVVNGEKRVK